MIRRTASTCDMNNAESSAWDERLSGESIEGRPFLSRGSLRVETPSFGGASFSVR